MNNTSFDLARLPCRQFKDGTWRNFQDEAATEIRLTLNFEDGFQKNLWAFPDGRLRDLALGHALLDVCKAGTIPEIVEESEEGFRLRIKPGSPPQARPWPGPLTPQDILEGAARFMEMAGRWDATGCFHRAAVFDPASRTFIHHVEDIGRHNCLDRMAGWALSRGEALAGRVLFVSARATASLVGKAVRTGYAMMVSRSAVTTAGVDIARKGSMSLIGFSRENRFSIFTDANERIAEAG
ncbi:formate dehydrogenase accessory sulfurtransferase FdhD [Fundidesulfovibrio soli]|uniref:formate dehydrogenase accessory sulfurtransferase FdhD n=1 Tax=Fundidesulfovibrio soli TaxID=2922716 RepID=UPI001FAED1AD|nr:formate dehydrogenase accessory sulfurtransferase FdhD [Fundidesulfovibrio soli]